VLVITFFSCSLACRLSRVRSNLSVPSSTAAYLPVFTLEPSGAGRLEIAVVAGRGPILSRDGRLLIYSTGRFPALVLTASALDGSNVRTLTDASAPVFNPVESPDGRLMDALVLPRRSHRVPERSQRSDGGVGDERGRNGSEADNELATGFSPAASDRG